MIPLPINYKDSFEYKDRTYYQTNSNKYLVTAEKLNTFMPTLKTKSNFCELISKKEYQTNKVLSLGDGRIKRAVQLTLF